MLAKWNAHAKIFIIAHAADPHTALKFYTSKNNKENVAGENVNKKRTLDMAMAKMQ